MINKEINNLIFINLNPKTAIKKNKVILLYPKVAKVKSNMTKIGITNKIIINRFAINSISQTLIAIIIGILCLKLTTVRSTHVLEMNSIGV